MLSPEDRTRSCATELVCRDCGRRLPLLDTTSKCLGCGQGLDIDYDYELAKRRLGEIPPAEREINIWRFEELLPIVDARAQARVGLYSGRTPLIHADRLGAELGLKKLYLKDDSTSRPSLSYKDRVVSMAVARLLELGKEEIGCVSTGNVGTAVASLAAKAGVERLRLLSGEPREGQGPSLPRPWRRGNPARRQLRPGEPRLPRAGARQRHPVRQHHPAPVLRRGGEDGGLRGRRAARLAGPGPHRDPGGRWNPLLARPQGPERARDGRPGRNLTNQDQRRPGRRLRPDRQCDPRRQRRNRAPVARTRRPTRLRSVPPATERWSSTR